MAKSESIKNTTLQSLQNVNLTTTVKETGTIRSLNDGIAWLTGLSGARFGELIRFKNETYGLILNLETDRIGTVILGEYHHLRVGDTGESTGQLLTIGVGDEILGRIVTPLGEVLDDKGNYKKDREMPVERIAPSIIERSPINRPVQTGIKAIDSVIPVGRGQRELIIGDRGTGKTAITIDTIINQQKGDIVCVYVAIGQKRSKVAQVVQKLKELGALDYTVVVVASASAPAPLRYIAPYAGCAIGEYFMEKGKDALVIYDDLTKHAWAYRELSLLLERPSGREAYPGDVFYLHSRLLERACQLDKKNGGGSLTALPIIETQAGDVSAYIPTNVISITDGQIYLESDLFFAGVRPALNVGLSVSRIGGAAQTKAMKKVAGKLRLDLSQYYELATFAQFATDLDPVTKAKIERGKRIVEILKQPQYSPMSVEDQVVVMYLVTSGGLDTIDLNNVKEYEQEFLTFVHEEYADIPKEIADTKEFNEETENKLADVIKKFTEEFKKLHTD